MIRLSPTIPNITYKLIELVQTNTAFEVSGLTHTGNCFGYQFTKPLVHGIRRLSVSRTCKSEPYRFAVEVQNDPLIVLGFEAVARKARAVIPIYNMSRNYRTYLFTIEDGLELIYYLMGDRKYEEAVILHYLGDDSVPS